MADAAVEDDHESDSSDVGSDSDEGMDYQDSDSDMGSGSDGDMDGEMLALGDEEAATRVGLMSEDQAFSILAAWLQQAGVGVPAQQALVSGDLLDPREVLPTAPPLIIAAVRRYTATRRSWDNSTRSRYTASAQGIGRLGVAAAAGDLAGLRRLVALEGADASKPSQLDGRTALWLAAEAGHPETVTFLAQQGGELEARHDMEAYHHGGWGTDGLAAARRCTAMYAAARRGHEQVVDLLLELGADPNTPDHLGRTSLSASCKEKRLDVVRRLAAQNDRRRRNDVLWRFFGAEGKAPVHCPAIDLDAATCIGRTPLFMAAEAGSFDIVELLADRGASTMAREDNGRSPLDVAHSHAIFEYLVRLNQMPEELPSLMAAELRLAIAKGTISAPSCPVATTLPYDLLEMSAAYLPERLGWRHVTVQLDKQQESRPPSGKQLRCLRELFRRRGSAAATTAADPHGVPQSMSRVLEMIREMEESMRCRGEFCEREEDTGTPTVDADRVG